MLGAMIGDIVGSVYEWHNIKTTDFEFFKPICTFTDDTVLTAATAQALMTDGDYAQTYQDFARRYAGRGYGGNFSHWIWAEKSSTLQQLGKRFSHAGQPGRFRF